MWAQGSAHPGRSQSNITIDFAVFNMKHRPNVLVRGSTCVEIPAQRCLTDTSITQLLLIPTITTYFPIITLLLLIPYFLTAINPCFYNPCYYP